MQPLLSFVKPIQKQHSSIASQTRHSQRSWRVEISTLVPLCTMPV